MDASVFSAHGFSVCAEQASAQEPHVFTDVGKGSFFTHKGWPLNVSIQTFPQNPGPRAFQFTFHLGSVI